MMDVTPEKAVHTLRTADPSSLFYYSQHIAEVVEGLIDQVSVLESLVRSIDQLNISEVTDNLHEVTISAKVSKQTLRNLLKAFANDELP